MIRRLHSLKAKILIRMVLFAIAITVLLGLVVAQDYFINVALQYAQSTVRLTQMASDVIDGDSITEYSKTKTIDEKYMETQHFMNSALNQSDIIYYYVFIPGEDDYEIIWAADSDKAHTSLGEHIKYASNREKAACIEALNDEEGRSLTAGRDEKYQFVATAYTAIENSKGERVGVAAASLSMPWVMSGILRFVRHVVIVIFIVTAIAILFLYRRVNREIIKPLVKLTDASKQIVENLDHEEVVSINIHTHDELERLANAITEMDRGLIDYIRQLSEVTAEKERIGAELNVATRIQSDMLPKTFPAFPDRNDIDLYATMNPAKEVGGDFYDFFLVDDDHLALVMADVSGKGVPAALFMVIAKTLIKNAAQHGLSPAEVLTSVNKRLSEGNDTGFFVTVWLAIINLKTGEGVAANAGHEHPVLCRKGEDCELVVYKHGLAVAAMDGLQYKEHEFKMNPGDKLFVYTDGVTEATNTDNGLYGTDRMLEVFNANKNAATKDILKALKSSIDDFAGEAPQFDDITMLGFEYKGN